MMGTDAHQTWSKTSKSILSFLKDIHPGDNATVAGIKSDDAISTIAIGTSREGRPIEGVCFGDGPRPVSLIAGAHADEPVGPITASVFPCIVQQYFPQLLRQYKFRLVPHINPDGALRNQEWFQPHLDFETYCRTVIREAPGDDIEFGFGTGGKIRPECQSAMNFFKEEDGPYAAHFSLHGMAFAEGAWFLINPAWRDQSAALRTALVEMTTDFSLGLHEIDRKGEKGFHRIAPGFSTTPNSEAMKRFFLNQGDSATAAKFHPNSMEFIQFLGGNPLCMVSELPLFRLTKGTSTREDPLYWRFKEDLDNTTSPEAYQSLIQTYGIQPVLVETQIKCQLGMILLALQYLLL